MKNTKLFLLSSMIAIFFTSCFKNEAQQILNSTLEIAGNKFESDWVNFKMLGNYSYCFSAGVNGVTPDRDGAASFNFYNDELEVYYSGATRVEELEGKVSYQREKYKLTQFETELYNDDENKFKSKKISAKWDGNKSFYCYLKKYPKGANKPTLNQQKEILQSDMYVETTELDSKKQDELLSLFTEDISTFRPSKKIDPLEEAAIKLVELRKKQDLAQQTSDIFQNALNEIESPINADIISSLLKLSKSKTKEQRITFFSDSISTNLESDDLSQSTKMSSSNFIEKHLSEDLLKNIELSIESELDEIKNKSGVGNYFSITKSENKTPGSFLVELPTQTTQIELVKIEKDWKIVSIFGYID